jgi:hypothetical protein
VHAAQAHLYYGGQAGNWYSRLILALVVNLEAKFLHDVPGLQDTALDSDKEADAAQLDEATGDGISDQDFTRGKRFRKLHRVLVSTVVRGCARLTITHAVMPGVLPSWLDILHSSILFVSLQIQRPIDRLRKTATAIAAGLALVHLGMFIMIYTMLNQQMQLVGLVKPCQNCLSMTAPDRTLSALELSSNNDDSNLQHHRQVNDLGLMGKAGILATEIALTVRNIRFCYTGNVGDGRWTPATLRWFECGSNGLIRNFDVVQLSRSIIDDCKASERVPFLVC